MWFRRIALSAYLAGIIVWLFNLGEIDVPSLHSVGYVPWFYYPVLLGLIGLLAMMDRWENLTEYILFALLAVLAAKAITLMKLEGVNFPYWEYRVIPVVAISLAIPASRALGKLKKHNLAPFVLSLVILGGYYSTALSFQRWYDVSQNEQYKPMTIDTVDLEYLSDKNLSGKVLALAYKSWMAVTLNTPFSARSIAAWYSEGPEVTNYYLKYMDIDKVFVSNVDIDLLNKENVSSYLISFYNQKRETPLLFNVKPSNIALNSSIAVVFPSDIYNFRRALILYHVLRDKLPPHVTYLSFDPEAPANGIYIGTKTNVTEINEEFPTSPHDLRWILVLGNFSEGMVAQGGRNIAISYIQLNNGTASAEFCPEIPEGSVSLIFDYKNLKNYWVARYDFGGLLSVFSLKNGKSTLVEAYRVPSLENCVNLSLKVVKESGTLSLNGMKFPLKAKVKLGVIGVETDNFRGEVRGKAVGTHVFNWKVPKEGTLIDLDSDLVRNILEKAYENVSSVEAPPLDLGLKVKGESEVGGKVHPIERPDYALKKFSAEGSVTIYGRLVKYIPLKGAPKIMSKLTTLHAGAVYYLGGKGFYAILGVEETDGFEDGIYVFRVPVVISFKGEGFLYGHPFRYKYVERLETIKAKNGNVTFLLADKTGLASVNVIRAPKASKLNVNWTLYLIEGILLALVIFFVLKKFNAP